MLNFISYNINGINHPIKRKKTIKQLRRHNCSVALLQETHLNDKEHKKLRKGWVGQVFSASCDNGKKRGVATLCHRSLCLVPEKVFEDKKGMLYNGCRYSWEHIYNYFEFVCAK